MRYFHYFIVWTTLALVLGPLVFVLLLLWELSQIPDLFDVSLTFDEEGA